MPSDSATIDWESLNGRLPGSSAMRQARPDAIISNTTNWITATQKKGDAEASKWSLTGGLLPRVTAGFLPKESLSEVEAIIPPIKSVPKIIASHKLERKSFKIIQEWEGYVVAIGDTTFTAHLVDMTAGDRRPKEQAEFLIEDLCNDDKPFLQEGGVFRWLIVYNSFRGTKERASVLYFRNLPAWRRPRPSEGKESSQHILGAIKWR
jgi:hypothetical protein